MKIKIHNSLVTNLPKPNFNNIEFHFQQMHLRLCYGRNNEIRFIESKHVFTKERTYPYVLADNRKHTLQVGFSPTKKIPYKII